MARRTARLHGNCRWWGDSNMGLRLGRCWNRLHPHWALADCGGCFDFWANDKRPVYTAAELHSRFQFWGHDVPDRLPEWEL